MNRNGLRNWIFIFCFVLFLGLSKAEAEAEAEADAAADSYDGTNTPAATTKSPGGGGGDKNECDVLNPTACNRNLLEVCAFREGLYRCECPPNHSRLSDGRCMVVNECFEKKFNDCSNNADCTDTLESFTCKCKSGYVDLSTDKQKPGRICKQTVDECSDKTKYAVNCDPNASCQNTEDSYTCVCNSGYVDASERYSLQAGRKCEKDGDPCASSTTNDCSKNATCTSCKGTYTCQCKSGFKDVSPNPAYPGRDCRPPESTAIIPSTTCDQQKKENQDTANCPCPQGTVRSSDGRCAAVDHCSGSTDCDPNASCINRADSYDCQCKVEYIDNSPDLNKRGRKCVLPENKCSSRDKNDCSPFATCHPNLNNYECICQKGYLDTSAAKGQPRGRVCLEEKDYCSDKSLHSCDENADCVKKPDGYACLCQTGFVDVSSSANLEPGRVCTLQTSCPSQPTDLMFLVDGSGSIGSALFKSEVLRFVAEFVALFKIGPSETRVGFIQFSDLFRKEFDLNQYSEPDKLKTAIGNVPYLAGLTHTGEAIDFMMKEGFGTSGARSDVRKVAIVITDGRAQDSVAEPAARARKEGVILFSVGVTDHVQQSQLEEIAGNKSRVFIVGAFKDLNTRLRAVIQKELCPSGPPIRPNECPNCDATRNYVCKDGKCVCPEEFCEDPVNKICGGQLCNPDLSFATCPYPSVCKKTPYNNHRCACPLNSFKCQTDGSCGGGNTEPCPANQKRNPSTNRCEGCNPPCDANKNQVCQTNQKGELACVCKEGYTLDCVTQVCTINECLIPGLNKCSQNATCTDTQQGYYCTCLSGYTDKSDGKGYICEKIENACSSNRHNCSQFADCIPDSLGGYTCKCKDGYIDKNPTLPGRECEKRDNECDDPKKNNCSKNADCFDLEYGYRCVCKSGYQDLKPTEDPGRFCFIDPCQDSTKNDCYMKRCRVIDIQTGKYECEPCPSGYKDMDPSRPGRNCSNIVVPICSDPKRVDCDPNAFCIGVTDKPDEYTCRCRDGYNDVSPDKSGKPGRKCEPIQNPCLVTSLNDCDKNYAHCRDLGNNQFNCTCYDGYRDKSPDPSKPGRICERIENVCLNSRHNCSTYAKCTYFEISNTYNCTCNPGYKDQSPPGLNGRVCVEIPDPCSNSSCDKHARCIRVGESDYTCECPPPYQEANDTQSQRRRCIYNGCGFAGYNICDRDANCTNGEDHVICKCNPGFDDLEPTHPGTKCRNVSWCGGIFCNASLGLTCNNGVCSCPSGWIQDTANSSCYETRIPTTPTPRICLDFPECPRNNGTCVIYKDYADCVCNQNYVDLRKYPPGQKRTCHGDTFCLLDVDIDYCCLQIHNCHPSASCLKLPTGGYQCRCKEAGTTVADNVACPPVSIPTPRGVAKDVKCEECNHNGDCIRSELTGDVLCQCATWYTGRHCETDVRVILAIIFAILFLLLTLCCLIYFCLKCRCFRGAGAGAGYYKEMDTRGSWGTGSDLYPPYTIPRPKLKEAGDFGAGGRETIVEDRSREERNLERFLESRDRVPSVERVTGGTEVVTDVAAHLPHDGDEYSESGSDLSSEASAQEQYERRVTTDYKKTETTRTTAAADATTAEFHIFPPQRSHAVTSSSFADAGGSGERSFRQSTTTTRYEEEDDATSEEGSYGSATTEDEGGFYDKKTLVKRSHQFDPSSSGRGGSEKFVTEVSSVSKSKDTKYL